MIPGVSVFREVTLVPTNNSIYYTEEVSQNGKRIRYLVPRTWYLACNTHDEGRSGKKYESRLRTGLGFQQDHSKHRESSDIRYLEISRSAFPSTAIYRQQCPRRSPSCEYHRSLLRKSTTFRTRISLLQYPHTTTPANAAAHHAPSLQFCVKASSAVLLDIKQQPSKNSIINNSVTLPTHQR